MLSTTFWLSLNTSVAMYSWVFLLHYVLNRYMYREGSFSTLYWYAACIRRKRSSFYKNQSVSTDWTDMKREGVPFFKKHQEHDIHHWFRYWYGSRQPNQPHPVPRHQHVGPLTAKGSKFFSHQKTESLRKISSPKGDVKQTKLWKGKWWIRMPKAAYTTKFKSWSSNV